jgi:hypothetical protein
MSESVSWVGLGISALLVVDKLFTKSKKIKCSCCGSQFEADSSISSPVSRFNDKKENIEQDEVHLDKVVVK